MDGTPIAGDGFTWITRDTTITLSCADQLPHPSDHVTLYAQYKVDNESWIPITTSDGYAQFKFGEDSVHTLQYYCVDVLGNTEATHTEVDKVDTVAPTTTKTYGTPFYSPDGNVTEWINSSTRIRLTPVDGGAICAVGNMQTYWKNTIVENSKCADQSSCVPTHEYGADWTLYTGSFTKPEQSCHMIEYWSVDALGNKEPIKAQCVFVENTPPEIVKKVGEPKHECTGAEWASYGSPDYGCYFITKDTKITLDCDDVVPHPADNVVLYYRDYLLGDTPPAYTPVPGGFAEIYKTEDSEHVLEFYCVDALGNTNGVHREIDIVDTQKPVSHKDLGTPKHACELAEQNQYYDPLHNPAQTDGCYFINQSTDVTLTCADGQPHPVDHVNLYYREYFAGATSQPDFTRVNADHVTFRYNQDSAHVLEWFCNDSLGNKETTRVEYDIVDTQKPNIVKTIVGPKYGACPPQSMDDNCFIDGVTTIHVESTDPESHPVDHVTCDWDYTVTDGTKTGTGQTGIVPPFNINFLEESTHVLTVTCKDKLGNSVTDVEKFIVDKTPPTTTKTYGTPRYPDDIYHAKWITPETQITLAVDDTGVHQSGIKETKYRVTLIGSDGPCQSDTVCQQQNGTGSWNTYSSAFTIGQESCHLIEYYSVDNVNKTEVTKKQCVFVDNSAPVVEKSIDSLVHACEHGEPCDYYITSQTPITLTCTDSQPHPVDSVKIYYRYYLDNETAPAYSTAGSSVTFYIPQDSRHVVEYYCVDALGNSDGSVKEPYVEIDVVDNKPPVSEKDLGNPKHACNSTEQSMYYPDMPNPTYGCYFVSQKTSMAIDCADQAPHPVDHVAIKYKYYLLGYEPSEWTTVEGDHADISVGEDSAHVLKWYCVDKLGNTETTHTEYDIVDTLAPVTTKAIVGPSFFNGTTEKLYIDGVTTIDLACTDQDPHPVDHEQIYYRYFVDDILNQDWTLYTVPFGFPEESKHTLEYYCIDKLDNKEETHSEIDYVDHMPPVTRKSYDGPQYTNETSEWITSGTLVTLSASDGDTVHSSGVAATYYRVTLLESSEPCQSDAVCQEQTGPGGFAAYASPFTIGEESCHLIEYYSVDNVNKTETVKKQCVFVDNSAPTPVKTVGKPRTLWDGSDAIYYNISGKCWNNASDSIDCWKVTTMTPVYLDCADPEPHPVDHEQTCFKVSWDGDDVTESYCTQHKGTMGGDGFCCVDHEYVGTIGFLFKEETEHELEYYCKDALGNIGPTDEEKFKVEGTSFDIQLNKKWNLISVPFTMLDDSIDEVFKDIENSVEGVWTYDAATDQWFVYKPGGGPNTLHEMKPGWGYWVLMKEPATLKIGGTLFSPGKTPPQRQLVHGWNLIGYYGTYGLLNYTGPVGAGDVSYCALWSLIDTTSGYPRWSSLETYWEPYNSDVWVTLSAYQNMDPGAGYWIEMDVPDTYTFSTVCGFPSFPAP
jgi:hypothetical protein